jgi:prevent-host-death family protein
MKTIYSIYEAKAHLSEIIRQVKNNKFITITERNVPVAKMITIKKEQPKKIEEIIEELENEGIVTHPRSSISNIKTVVTKRNALKKFLESRK